MSRLSVILDTEQARQNAESDFRKAKTDKPVQNVYAGLSARLSLI